MRKKGSAEAKGAANELPKSLAFRLHELTQSLCLVRDSLGAVRGGITHFLIPLYGQMRALLSRDGNNPLLFSLADELDLKLKLFCMQGVDKPLPKDLTNAVFHLSGPPFTINQIMDAQEEILLSRFLRLKTVRLRDKLFSINDIIGFLANKAGGAHYDKTLPKEYAEIFSVDIGIPVISDQLCQVAEVVYALGRVLLKKISDFELYVSFAVPRQVLAGPHFILLYQYPDSPMQVALSLDQARRIRFSVTDLHGNSADVLSDRQIEFDQCNSVAVSFHIGPRLSSVMQIILNGVIVAHGDFAQTLEVRNDFDWFRKEYSKAATADPAQGPRIGLAEFYAFAGELDALTRGRSLAYLADRRRDNLIWFEAGSSGYSEPGQKGMTMRGDVKHGPM